MLAYFNSVVLLCSLTGAFMLQGVRADSGADCAAAAAVLDDYDSSKEMAVEMRCADAFTVILHFERTHCLALQARCPMSPITQSLFHLQTVFL